MGVGTLRRHRDYSKMPQPVLQPEHPPIGGSSVEPVKPAEPVVAVTPEEPKPATVTVKPATKPGKHKIVEAVETAVEAVAVIALEVAKEN